MHPRFHTGACQASRRGRTLAAVACLCLLALAGCASAPKAPPKPKVVIPDAPPVPADSEVVLDNGERLTATTDSGKIRIEAGPGLLRTLHWDGTTRYVVMKPRSKDWYGAKGIYFDGRPDNWKTHNGLSKLRYEESERHFEKLVDAKIWLQIRRIHYVYTKTGLVVGWRRRPNKNTLQVEVWQFYIDGKKPALMPGAQDYRIHTSQAPVKQDQDS